MEPLTSTRPPGFLRAVFNGRLVHVAGAVVLLAVTTEQEGVKLTSIESDDHSPTGRCMHRYMTVYTYDPSMISKSGP